MDLWVSVVEVIKSFVLEINDTQFTLVDIDGKFEVI